MEEVAPKNKGTRGHKRGRRKEEEDSTLDESQEASEVDEPLSTEVEEPKLSGKTGPRVVDVGPKSGEFRLCRVHCGPGILSDPLVADLVRLTDGILPCLGKQHIEFILEEPGTVAFFCHDENGTAIAGACMRRACADMFQLTFLCVEDDYRLHKRYHFGTLLLRRLLSHARQYRAGKVAVYADNDAVGFFEKHKFQPSNLPDNLVFWLDEYLGAKLMAVDVADVTLGNNGGRKKKKKKLNWGRS